MVRSDAEETDRTIFGEDYMRNHITLTRHQKGKLQSYKRMINFADFRGIFCARQSNFLEGTRKTHEGTKKLGYSGDEYKKRHNVIQQRSEIAGKSKRDVVQYF